MAGTHQRTTRGAVAAAVLSLLAAAPPASGQGTAGAPAPEPSSAPPAAAAAMPAPFSRDCQVGQDAFLAGSPLPNVAEALARERRIRILTIGASPAVGRRPGRGGYADQIRTILQQAVKGLNVVMINRGVSGELADQASLRIRTEVALTEPDLVLWQVGTNDALAYVPLDDLRETVVETVRWLRERKVDVVLVGLQYTDRMAQDDHYRQVRELMRKIAAEENVMIVRRYEAQRLLEQAQASGGGLLPDEFERSEAGYACLSQYMARAITLGVFAPGLKPRPPQNPPPQSPQPKP